MLKELLDLLRFMKSKMSLNIALKVSQCGRVEKILLVRPFLFLKRFGTSLFLQEFNATISGFKLSVNKSDLN